MKANEAPEKIYIFENPIFDFAKLSVRQSDTDIEYTRTDALIEKAFDAYCKVCGHFPHSVPTHICRHDCWYFSDFRRYIKGE